MLTGSLIRSPRCQPLLVAPGVARGEHDRRGGGRMLGAAGHGVGLAPPPPVGAADVELVAGAVADSGHEQLPHPRAAERAHRVAAPVPVAEVADDPRTVRVRRPYGERGAADLAETDAVGAVLAHVRAKHLPELLVPALADQVQVGLAERGQ